MSTYAEHPYTGYKLYIVHHKKMNRRMACLVNPYNRKDRKTISYARYLFSVHLKRILSEDETVDHINNDKMDDRIDNFQILSRKDNKAKSQGKRTFINYTCPSCSSIFSRRKGASYNVKFPSCSKVCAGKYSHIKSKTV